MPPILRLWQTYYLRFALLLFSQLPLPFLLYLPMSDDSSNEQRMFSTWMKYMLVFKEVRTRGLEPLRLAAMNFLHTMTFATLSICALECPLTISFDLGFLRPLSTPSLSGLARDCHQHFHLLRFPRLWRILIHNFHYGHSIFYKFIASTNSAIFAFWNPRAFSYHAQDSKLVFKDSISTHHGDIWAISWAFHPSWHTFPWESPCNVSPHVQTWSRFS